MCLYYDVIGYDRVPPARARIHGGALQAASLVVRHSGHHRCSDRRGHLPDDETGRCWFECRKIHSRARSETRAKLSNKA